MFSQETAACFALASSCLRIFIAPAIRDRCQETPPMQPSELRRAIPLLPQPNIGEAIAFYRDRLGFEEAFVYPQYGGVRRGPVEIHFWQSDNRNLAERTSCRIEVEGVDALYAEYQAKGVVHPNGKLELKPWGFTEFSAV